MATFTDVANEIIAETGLDDIAIIIYPYLYDTVRSICGLREDWRFLLVDRFFQVDAGSGTHALSTFSPPVRLIQSFMVIDAGNLTLGGNVYVGTNKVFFPTYITFDDFWRLRINAYVGGANGMPEIYTLGVFPADSPGNLTLHWKPKSLYAYTMHLNYYIDHPTGTGETIYVPNTELIKAGVKIRIYGDRGDQTSMQSQTAIFNLALKDLQTRYGAGEAEGRNRVKRYF